MADPVVVAVADVGVALTRVLLRACDSSVSADLVGDVQELVGVLSRSLRRTDESKDQIEHRISQALAARTEAMRERCSSQGVDPDLLSGACTEVEIILEEIADDGALLLSAVRTPESFPETLREYAARRRMNVDAAAEPYFDELVGAVAAEYSALAPWSPRFQIEAFKSILSGIDEMRDDIKKLLDYVPQNLHGHNITHEMLQDQTATHSRLENKVDSIINYIQTPKTKRIEHTVWGSYPHSFKESIERHPTCNGRTLQDTILNPLAGAPTVNVLIGPVGIGKTFLAADIAHKCKERGWSLIAWINASTRTRVKSELIALGQSILGIEVESTGNTADPTIHIKQVLARLSESNKGKILFVYDGLKTINDLTGLLPTGPHIQTIVTTRSHCAWEKYNDYNAFYIDKFTRTESIRLILKISGSTDEIGANDIANFVDDLPLAVTQAAFAARIMSLTTHESNNLSVFSEHIQRSPTNALRAIDGTTYSEDTLQALAQAAHAAMNTIGDEQYEDGMRILMAMTYLSESGVPTQLLTPTNSVNEIRAYQHLIDNSILTSSHDGRFTYLHTLQGAAIRNYWNKTESKVASRVAGTLLFLTLKSCLKETNFTEKVAIARNIIGQLSAIQLQTYSAQVLACQSAIHCLHTIFPLALELNISHDAIQLKDALTRAFSEGYIDTHDYYITIGNLANCYLDAGLPQSALRLYQDALHNLECLLESSDINILALKAGLARSYTALENYDEAIHVLLSTLVELKSTVGAYDVRTLRTRSYLADCFLTKGDYQSAKDQYELIYSFTKYSFGESSSETLAALNNLAMLRSVYFPSESLNTLVVNYNKIAKILDIDHPHCIAAANNIANLLERIGRIGEACALYELLLKKQIHIFGSEHTDTLRTRTYLASAWLKLGDAEKALALFNYTPLTCHTTSPSDRSLIELAYKKLEAAKRKLEQQEKESPTD